MRLFANASPLLEPSRLPKGHVSPSAGAEGDVYVSTQGQYSPPVDTVVRAVDPDTGSERWRARLPVEVVTTPVVSGGTVWASGEASVAAFDAATGEPRGSWGPGTRECLDPVPVGQEGVALANWGGRFVARLEPGRKDPVWRTEVGHAYGPAAVGPERVYASVYVDGNSGALQALDAATGEPVWRYECATPLYTAPAAGPDGVVYLPEGEALVALDASGEELWKAPLSARPGEPAVSPDGETVFVGDASGTVLALDADTGALTWRVSAGGPVRHAPALADGVLAVTSGDHTVALVDADRGLLQGQVEVDGYASGSPVPLPDGSFLVRNAAGHTVRLSRPPASASEEVEPGVIAVEAREIVIGDVRLPRSS